MENQLADTQKSRLPSIKAHVAKDSRKFYTGFFCFLLIHVLLLLLALFTTGCSRVEGGGGNPKKPLFVKADVYHQALKFFEAKRPVNNPPATSSNQFRKARYEY